MNVWDSSYVRSEEEVTADGHYSKLSLLHLQRHGSDAKVEPVLDRREAALDGVSLSVGPAEDSRVLPLPSGSGKFR